ncbi:kri1 [[Candida] subhashii]|uniref:Kri1 n=1 Tax=[Candida] subhashii TaxID=561895 RepID=A0A8J5USC7_9ASCO|nr:kri1 [[Candida] subhashii]KAG7660530.1 kri1 [[Candida] subhashii]
MARKKSAAKKAREAAEKAAFLAAEPSEPTPEPTPKPKRTPTSPPSDESDESPTSSSDEEEDEFGDLITEDVEQGINKVLETIKTDPKKLLNPDLKFFEDPEKGASKTTSGSTKEKPIYLKDYHRMNLLSGGYQEDDEEEDTGMTVDGEKSYVTEQREERDKILSDIKKAFEDDIPEDDDEEDDGDFLKKKESNKQDDDDTTLPIGTALPNPDQNPSGFLNAFLDQQAWIPKKGDKIINLDKIDQDIEEDFDNAVEKFETTYNFRYEDANSAEIVSYARNQATLRRGATNSRKRQREKKLELKAQEEREKTEALKKKKTNKLEKVVDRLTKIKEAVGGEVSDEVIEKVFGDALLQEDFDDADWDNKMAEIFNEQYYDAEITKPEWDDDDEIMADFNQAESESEDQVDDDEPEIEEPPLKQSKKEILKQKKSLKKQSQSIKQTAQKIIESHTHQLIDEVEEERGRSKGREEVKFKYREVSPESFGLSTREIILADDKQLNTFIGIKKFAPYRPRELRMKDKRKYTKKKNLQEWRKEVFRDKNGPRLPEEAKDDEIWIPMEEEYDDRRQKKSKHKQKR